MGSVIILSRVEIAISEHELVLRLVLDAALHPMTLPLQGIFATEQGNPGLKTMRKANEARHSDNGPTSPIPLATPIALNTTPATVVAIG